MTRVWMRELAGWMLAAAVALATTVAVASSPRGELMFRDGDSLVVALASRSLLEGEAWDWAMSSVLFLPEIAVFTALAAVLPLAANGLFAVNAVVNVLGLYGALRLAAGRRRPGAAPVAWSLLALCAFGLLAAAEQSASRDALEPASLLLTTTYYSATTIAAIATVGIVRRSLDRGALRAWPVVGLVLTAGVSTLSNPLYAAWAAVPGLVALGIVLSRGATGARTGHLATLATAVFFGVGAGFLGRIPLSAYIANTGAGYAQPDRWLSAAGYYGDLLAARLADPLGVLWLLVLLALLTIAAVRTAKAAEAGARFVAASAWLAPLLIVVGAVALGTHAARYLQPIVFAPLLALVAVPRARTVPVQVQRAVAVVLPGALLLTAGLSVPRISAVAQRPDADLSCVTEWIDASGRHGAGQFWTARLPKLHLDDPSQLVQVDHRLNGYAWLVNRADYAVGAVSFLVEDAQTVPWRLPAPAIPVDVVDCGRYRVLDLGERMLPLGPAHS